MHSIGQSIKSPECSCVRPCIQLLFRSPASTFPFLYPFPSFFLFFFPVPFLSISLFPFFFTFPFPFHFPSSSPFPSFFLFTFFPSSSLSLSHLLLITFSSPFPTPSFSSFSSFSPFTFSFLPLPFLFTCESSYCFQHVLAIAILSVRLSVHPSVTRVDQSKTVQGRITKSLPSAAWKTLVSGTVKLFHKFEGGHPELGC